MNLQDLSLLWEVLMLLSIVKIIFNLCNLPRCVWRVNIKDVYGSKSKIDLIKFPPKKGHLFMCVRKKHYR